MNITVTMQQVLDFKEIVNDFREKKLPLPCAYKLIKISNALDKDIEFYQSKFQEIIENFAKKNNDGSYAYSGDGSQIMIQDDKIDECNDELEKLMSLEIQVDNLDFSIDNFGTDIECTPDELEKLAPFLN